MKLELKHLAPYLPYGLKLNLEIRRMEVLLKGLQDDNDVIHSLGKTPIEFCKPILRPLSDLTKEIEINGDKFIPSSRTVVGMIHGGSHFGIGIVENRITTNTITYADMSYLLSLHFDVFNLIPKGLAIDINTLT